MQGPAAAAAPPPRRLLFGVPPSVTHTDKKTHLFRARGRHTVTRGGQNTKVPRTERLWPHSTHSGARQLLASLLGENPEPAGNAPDDPVLLD